MKRRWMGGALALVSLAAIAAGCGGGGGGASATHRVTVVVPTLNASPAIYGVLLNDSAGRLVSSSAVTSPGPQVVQVPHAGSVTFAAAVGSTNFHWTTVVDPPDGSTLTFSNRLATPTPTPATGFQTWNVTVTAFPGASVYFVYGPCGYSTTSDVSNPVTVTSESCPEVTSAKVFVAANDGSGQPIAWHQTASLAATPGGTTGIAVTLDRTDVVQVFSIFQNLPADASNVSTYIESTDPSFVQRFNAPAGFGNASVPLGAPAAGVSFRYPAVGGVFAEESVFGNTGAIIRQRSLASPVGALAFDLQGLELPSFPSFDGPSATFSWGMPVFGFGQTLDERLADQVGLGDLEVTVALPPGVQTYTLPEVPPEFLPPDPLVDFYAQGGSIAPDIASISSFRDFVEHFDDDPVYGFRLQDGVFLVASLPF